MCLVRILSRPITSAGDGQPVNDTSSHSRSAAADTSVPGCVARPSKRLKTASGGYSRSSSDQRRLMRVIQVQACDRGTSTRRQPRQLAGVRIELEVVGPAVGSWIEE